MAVGLGLGVGFGFGLELGNRCEFSWMSKTTGRAVVSLLDISFLYFTYKTHGHAGQLGGGPTRFVVCHLYTIIYVEEMNHRALENQRRERDRNEKNTCKKK